MRFASLTGMKTRLRDRVDNASRGSDVPAGIERGADAVAPSGPRERARLRRRLRELRRLREAQLLELGALVLEAHKHGRDGTPIIATKADEAAATDAEARAIADALATDPGLDTMVAAGIADPCPTCGTLASTAARFCSTCGTPLDGRPDAAPRSGPGEAPETPLVDAREAHAAPRESDSDAQQAGAPASEIDVDRSSPPALEADSDQAGGLTTALPAANGNGGARDQAEATTGRKR
jgi:hypothetical protein